MTTVPDRKKRHAGAEEQGKTKRGIMALISMESNSDVLGSYTGTPKDGLEPTQDADDL